MSTTTRVLYDSSARRDTSFPRNGRRPEPMPEPTPPPATAPVDAAPAKPDKTPVTISTQVQCDGIVFTVAINAPLTPATLKAFARKLKAQGLAPVPSPIQWTPEGKPICPKHRVLMTERNKQGEIWYSHAIKDQAGRPILDRHGDPIYCRGHGEGKNSPGWDHPTS